MINEETNADIPQNEIFEKELQEYLEEYEKHLSLTLKKETVRKHSYVISYCIEYISLYHGVKGFEEITFGLISSKMYYDFESNTQEGMSRKAVFNIIKKYFEFIRDTFGVSNPILMKKIASAKI